MEPRAQPDAAQPPDGSRWSRLRPYLGVALLVLAVGTFSILIVREIAQAPPPVEIRLPEPTQTPSAVTVHVGGAVSSPGVYALPVNSRVIEAVEAAGGLTDGANTNAANMAQELEEGASYVIPSFEAADENNPIVVYVSGAVHNAGLYTLPAGSRVTDAIDAAGGLSELADRSEINFAARLSDGERYDVPSRDESNGAPVFVHLVGAVQNPGTYTLPSGARLVDALDMAGGVASDADVDAVDLAVALEDGQRYYVPYRGEQAVGAVTVHVAGAVTAPGLYTLPTGSRLIDAIAAAGGVLSTADIHTLNLAQPIEDGARYAVPQIRATVNVNVAGVTELESVPGISRTVAQAIVNYRSAAGAFTNLDDLLNVPGIGPATLAAIRPFLSIS